MGIDLVKRGRIKNSNKVNTRSTNLYSHLLIKLFRFLTRRTDSAFCKTVLRRLISSRTNRPPISIQKIAKLLKGQDKIVVFVGSVTDDIRLLELPKIERPRSISEEPQVFQDPTPSHTLEEINPTTTRRVTICDHSGKCKERWHPAPRHSPFSSLL